MTRTEERTAFLALLLREFPERPYSQVLDLARTLQREARAMQTWAERVCSVEMTEAEENAGHARDERRERRITALCQEWGITPVFQGDPRGAMIKLQVKSGRTNDWGNSGICVPEGN